ncbi:MAG: hypothetical protein LUC22_03905, partial [Prevotella sp.]|nr:hypothetical protein [Prevotella sp.]
MCYVVPIVMSEDEYWDYQDAKDDDPDAQPEGYITETPSAFNEYVGDNAEKIQAAWDRGTAPYWVRDNAGYVSVAMGGETRAIYPVSTAKSVSATADAGT